MYKVAHIYGVRGQVTCSGAFLFYYRIYIGLSALQAAMEIFEFHEIIQSSRLFGALIHSRKTDLL